MQARIIIRLCVIATILGSVMWLPAGTWPSADSASARSSPAVQLPHQFEIDGPFPTYHGVRVFVGSVTAYGRSDQFTPNDEVRFRLRLDEGPCDRWEEPLGDEVYLARMYNTLEQDGVPDNDCDYAHEVRRGTYSVSAGDLYGQGETVELDAWLPEPTEEQVAPRLLVHRYRGGLVRARLDGTEDDVFQDDFIGTGISVFVCGYRDGAGQPCEHPGALPVNTCNEILNPDSESPRPLCYDTVLEHVVSPEPPEADDDLVVAEVWGQSSQCIGGRDFDLGVKLRNAGAATTPSFRVRVGLLDPDTRRIADEWHSPVQAGLASGAETELIPLTLNPPGGGQQFMVSAQIQGAREFSGPDISLRPAGDMASASEFSLRCLPGSILDPVVPLFEPTPTLRIAEPQDRLPTPTPTPDADVLEPPFRRVTPTSTPERPGIDLPGPR